MGNGSNAAGKSARKPVKVKTIIIIAVIVLLILAVVLVASSVSMMSGMTYAETSKLEKKNLENTVSVSGIVESSTFKSVASNLSYNVETVNVEVGDKVKKGDILCTLNTDDLQDQILQQQASIDAGNISSEYSISEAEKSYNETLAKINDGTYPEIYNAKNTLDNAQSVLDKAEAKYKEQSEIAGTDRDSQLVSAENSVESAKSELDYAYADYTETKEEVENEDYSSIKQLKEAYDEAKKEYNSRHSADKNEKLRQAREKYETALEYYKYLSAMYSSDPSIVSADSVAEAKAAAEAAKAELAELEVKYDVKNTEDAYEQALDSYTEAKANIDAANKSKLTNAERTYERAKSSYETAQKNLELVKNGNDISLKEYKDAVTEAQKSLDSANENYSIAVKNAESTLASLKASADREKMVSENNSQIVALDILMKKLDEAVITAPCDGTVTSVNALEGSAAVGTLFIIEDTDNLKMTATVKEYSVGELKEGMDVTVKASALGDKEFDGVISKIAPTAVKGPDGKSDGTSSFSIEVLIRDTKDSGMLIGMTAKMTAVTDSAENVFAVGYDALVEDSDGSSYIFAADSLQQGTAAARRIDVETGFESDAEIEIISDELTEGMEIINNGGDMTDGGVVIIANELAAAVAAQ
ncbi:MAG: efflux RND transporter periplasmic adaptor subunit [Huintestinicola sp.]